MDDCPAPKSHESIKMELKDKVSKKVAFTILLAVGIPLFITGVKVWSGQASDPLRYVTKQEMSVVTKDVIETKAIVKKLDDQMLDLKKNQNESQRDIKEILRHLRNSK